ncbi:MAG: LPXTG cell wall anchor domain-containing protein [Thomasclavelia sp.]|nr:LPXTG cell wall anchor domain-containing protein [Thomasclavelia sp.]
MKKLLSIIFTLILLFSSNTPIKALSVPTNADNIDISATSSKVNISGKIITDDCVAVFISLYTSDGKTMIRSESADVTTDKLFSTTINDLNLTESSYMIKIANYDGSDWATKSFSVNKETDKQKDVNTVDNKTNKNTVEQTTKVNTGDSTNLVSLVSLMILAVGGIILTLKRTKKD